jgi:hypothetical protein
MNLGTVWAAQSMLTLAWLTTRRIVRATKCAPDAVLCARGSICAHLNGIAARDMPRQVVFDEMLHSTPLE